MSATTSNDNENKPITTVGQLKELLSTYPDNATFCPEWFDGPPSDYEPGIVLHGFEAKKSHVAVLVSLFYLNEENDVEEDSED